MKKDNPIRHRFILRLTAYFFVVSLVPVILFSFITSNITRTKALSEMEQRTAQTVGTMYADLNAAMEEISALGLQLSREPAVLDFVSKGLMEGETEQKPSGRTNIALYRLYGLTSGLGAYSTTHIVSAEHEAWISTTEVPECYYPKFGRNWGIFSMAVSSEETVFRINDHNQNMIPNVCFSAATAVRDESGIARGYVVQDIYRQRLTDALQKYRLDQEQKIYLINRNGFLVYTNDRSYDPDRLNRFPEDPGAGTEQYLESGEGICFLYFSEASRYGLHIISCTPIAGILKTNRYIRSAAFWAGGLCILLAMLFSLLANRDVAAPIRKLTEAFRFLEEGKLGTRIGEITRTDEFGQLETGFNTMAGKLEEQIRSSEEKQQRLRMAQSSALQAQINPHFLYNTLDLIKWNAKLGNNEEVSRIAVLLGKLLRSMADFEHDVVTVEEELKLIGRYLEIQKIHHGESLTVREEIREEVLPLYIPKLIVQPLVENAVVHGIDPEKKENIVGIRAETDGAYIVFTITDNGKGMDPETLEKMLAGELTGRTGIGLANVIKRSALYGDENCGVTVNSVTEKGTEVKLKIRPLNEPEETADV